MLSTEILMNIILILIAIITYTNDKIEEIPFWVNSLALLTSFLAIIIYLYFIFQMGQVYVIIRSDSPSESIKRSKLHLIKFISALILLILSQMTSAYMNYIKKSEENYNPTLLVLFVILVILSWGYVFF